MAVSYTSDTWGTFTVTGASVTESDGTYTVTGSGKTVMGMSADSQSEYDCTLSATIKSADDFTFTFDIPAVMGGLKITVQPGEAPASSPHHLQLRHGHDDFRGYHSGRDTHRVC